MTNNNNDDRSAAISRWPGPLLAGATALLLSACAGLTPPDGGDPALPSSAEHAAAPDTPRHAEPQAAAAVARTPDGAAANPPSFPLPLYREGDASGPTPADAESRQQQADAEAAARTASAAVDGPSIRFSRRRDGVDADQDADDGRTIPGPEIDRGTASWYGLQFHGRRTASGERYNMYELTAAHKTLPFNTIVQVKSLQTGRMVRVRINDRGPFVRGRVIDLSKAAAEELGLTELGIKPVSLMVAEWPDGTLAGGAAEAAPAPRRSVARSRR